LVGAGAGDSTLEDDSSILESSFAFVNLPELFVTEYIKIAILSSVYFAHQDRTLRQYDPSL
jgi:hypothetical protein